jgi:alpha-L-rhamnosidase
MASIVEVTMATVPENQKVEKILETRFNDDFAQTAEGLTPILRKWTRLPQRLVQFDSDKSFFGLRAYTDERPIKDLPSLSFGKRDEFTIDFGTHVVGHFSFHLAGEGTNIDAPCRLRLTFGESPYDVTEDLRSCDTWISTSWLPDEVINVDWLPCEVSMERRYSFRYVRIQIIDTSPKYKVKFTNISCQATSAIGPPQEIEIFEFHDDLLQAMDDISIFTLRDCMQTVFEDGPRRDRRLWLGDLRLQALTNYHTFRNYDLMKRCLYLFAALPREDDSLPACLFEKPKLTPASDYLVDYDALFGPIVSDYVLASGDTSTGRELWPTIQGSLKRALAHLDPVTHIFDSSSTTAWKFLDWATNLDTSAGMHGLLLYALKQVNSLAELLQIKPLPYTDAISKMTTAAPSFYDETNHLFISGPTRQISLASAAWLSLSGAFPKESCKAALLNALSHPDCIKPLTPYLYHHICEALALSGAEAECLHLMKEYWGGMVKAGADTFWECFDPLDPRSSPYGDVRNNSFCHAWSCTPSYLLRHRLREFGRFEVVGRRTVGELDEEWIGRNVRGERLT